ncbi:MAG: hypothetical protein ACRCU2_33155 [Planktothrix sp.]
MTSPRSVITLITALALSLGPSDGLAQVQRPTRTSSLGELGCVPTLGSARYSAINRDVPVGRQMFTAIGILQRNSDLNSVDLVCRLAAPNQPSRFKTLTLDFGFSDRSRSSSGSNPSVTLSMYTDGNLYGSQTVTFGDRILWPIDVTNVQSIAIEARCVNSRGGYCPPVFFFEDTLE